MQSVYQRSGRHWGTCCTHVPIIVHLHHLPHAKIWNFLLLKTNWKCKMVPALKPVSRKLKIIILLGSCTQRVKYYFSLLRELTLWVCSTGVWKERNRCDKFSWGPQVLGHRLVLQYIIIIQKYSTRGVSCEQKNITEIQQSFVQRCESFFRMAWSECECRIK